MVTEENYPTGPIKHFLKQIEGLQRFRDENRSRFDDLTDREVEVLILVAEGLKNPAVAKQLGVSRVTVQNHRAQIRDKLGINSQIDYVKFALAFDLISF